MATSFVTRRPLNEILSTNLHHQYLNLTMKPFEHQVGGHVDFLCLDPSHLCKPFEHREGQFYQNMPKEITRFAPICCGELQMTGEEDAIACSSINITDHSHSHHKNGKSSQSRPKKRHFLVLENLVAGMRAPCIMDLKMGTRHYGDDANPDKIAMQKERAASTTSGEYGVRLCGMQMFDASTGQYLCFDKYFGRRLDLVSLRNVIRRFLLGNCGGILTKRLIEAFLHRLNALYKTIALLHGLRLYSSSLLLIYDGTDQIQTDTEKTIDVRMVDFAHATFPSFLDDPKHEGVDSGYLLGLRTLIEILTWISSSIDHHQCHT